MSNIPEGDTDSINNKDNYPIAMPFELSEDKKTLTATDSNGNTIKASKIDQEVGFSTTFEEGKIYKAFLVDPKDVNKKTAYLFSWELDLKEGALVSTQTQHIIKIGDVGLTNDSSRIPVISQLFFVNE